MHYYIDGYNLLFRTAGSSVGHLKSHRETLITNLNTKITSLKLDVTVVFDSQYLVGEGSRTHYKHLEICFTPLGMTADEFILSQLQHCRSPQREIVITSDKDLAYKARNFLASTQSIEEFLGWLNKRYKKKQSESHHYPKKVQPKIKLRNQKSLENIQVHIEEKILKSPPVIEKVSLPMEGSFEFYLAAFEENLKIFNHSDLPKSSKSFKTIKNKKLPVKIEHSHLSEEERWLKIFLERLTDFKN